MTDSLPEHYGSVPDLSSTDRASVSERKKRKYETDKAGELSLRQMFDALNKKMEVLQLSVNTIKEQNSDLTLCVETLSQKHDDFLKKISLLEQERKEDKKKIELLEDKIDSLERKNRSSGIEIRNIPKSPSETKEKLCEFAKTLGKTLNVEIDDTQIKDIYRINSKDTSNPIILEFTSSLPKDKILKEVKNFNKNKAKGEKLNSNHLGFTQPQKPIFVSETLSTKAQRIFYLARNFQKQHEFSFCWTSNGIVYLRKNEKSGHVKISSESDLESLRQKE